MYPCGLSASGGFLFKGNGMNYAEKLKDPRWQKKRLKILERDNWCCQWCGTEENTLNVHHLKYSNGDPWDIEDHHLTTLCEDCHEKYPELINRAIENLVDVVKSLGFDVYSIDLLGYALSKENVADKLVGRVVSGEFKKRTNEINIRG